MKLQKIARRVNTVDVQDNEHGEGVPCVCLPLIAVVMKKQSQLLRQSRFQLHCPAVSL